jgi:hypothetical protein
MEHVEPQVDPGIEVRPWEGFGQRFYDEKRFHGQLGGDAALDAGNLWWRLCLNGGIT